MFLVKQLRKVADMAEAGRLRLHVASSRTAYDLALGDALSHQESVARVRAAAEEHEHGHQ
ncbi:hypothetical protein [Streptomyces sp. DH18]|uniref:hypothetical protein n=1 Tax=Streptomyces sp. DH18 TaxID=3040126 RepID=UPI003FA6F31B